MPSEVAYLVSTDQTYPVITLTGALPTGDDVAVRNAVLSVLAGQPEAVVIDVEAATAEDGTAARTLGDLARATADWPASHIVLCTSHPGPWAASGLSVFADRATAFAELGPPHPGRSRQLGLEPVVGAARRARELVTEACAHWECPDLCGPACIVVTEMVNNVVAHAKSTMTVLLAHMGGTISVAVRDRSATIPRFTGPVAPTAYGGRGLLLIDSVSDRWGSLALPDGKVVWSLLALDQSTGPAEHRVSEAGIPGPARG